jgi:hypothetical protein
VRETAEVVATRLAALGTGTRLLLGFELPLVTSAAFEALERTEGLADDNELSEADEAALPGGGRGRAQRRRSGRGRRARRDRRAAPQGLRPAARRRPCGQPRRDRRRGARRAPGARGRRRPDPGRRRGAGAAGRLGRDAYQEGGGAAFAVVLGEDPARPWLVFSERFECRTCGITYELPQPRLFSFNNPFGACPTCHGFGNVIELDLDLVVPGPVEVDQPGRHRAVDQAALPVGLAELKRAARPRGVRLDVPWVDLTDEERRFVVDGDGAYEGIRGFFAWLERKKYKVHVRVFLSRYRGYQTCPSAAARGCAAKPATSRWAGARSTPSAALTVREARRSSTRSRSRARCGGGREGPA